ncbi:MAG TPA: CoA-transferase [Streptosporangiaceae bacterium]|jgi:3-oxoacid CoA-transferase subunit A
MGHWPGPPETAEGNSGQAGASAAEAVGDVPSGASLAVGGFGLCGIPSVPTEALV